MLQNLATSSTHRRPFLKSVAACAASLAYSYSARGDEPAFDGMPYHPLVYSLDLAILSYQLHAQSLVWPFDPYYEEFKGSKGDRAGFTAKVRSWASSRGTLSAHDALGLDAYRGPGIIAGFADNPMNDPIIYNWARNATSAIDAAEEHLSPIHANQAAALMSARSSPA
jgi:hypothetical protein